MSIEADQSKDALFGELQRIAHLRANPQRELTKSQLLLKHVQDALGSPEVPTALPAKALIRILNIILDKARSDALSRKQGMDVADPEHAQNLAAAGEFLCITDIKAFQKNFVKLDAKGALIPDRNRFVQYQSRVGGKGPTSRGVRAQRAAIWLESDSPRTGERHEKPGLEALADELDTYLQDPPRMAELRRRLMASSSESVTGRISSTETTKQPDTEELAKPSLKPRRYWLRRVLIWVSSVIVTVTLLAAWLTNGGYHWAWVWIYRLNSAATCDDIGNRDHATPEPKWSGPFRAAYERAGGKPVLGCPRTDDPSGYVHLWAAGWSQDLQGGRVGIARIMALNPQHVIVMAGSYWHDYTDQGNGQPNSDAAQQKGYPTSNPVPCGPGRLVLLDQSQEGESPGAMVTDARNAHFIWLPKLIWMGYRATGGPFGRLGLPLGQEQPTPTGQLQRFQHGYVLLTGGVTRTNLEQAGHTEPTNPHAVTRLAECIALTRK